MNEEKTIYLLRHAQTSLPDEKKRFVGQTNPPLSLSGLLQSSHLASVLSHHDLQGIYCSDLLRSEETAHIIASEFGLKAQSLKAFREVSLGDWDGLSFDEVRDKYPHEFDERGKNIAYYRTPGGESFIDLRNRVLPEFFKILSDGSGSIAIIGHAGVNRVILCHILSIPLEKMFIIKQDYATINTIIQSKMIFSVTAINNQVSFEHSLVSSD